jgi:hypothetical protein
MGQPPRHIANPAARQRGGRHGETVVRECAARRCRRNRSAACPPGPTGASEASGSRLCPPCVDRLRSDLRGLPDVYRDSDHALTPAPPRVGERVSGSRTVGIVLDDRAVAARSRLTDVLASWARLVVDERRVHGPGEYEVAGLVRFLGRHLDWLAAHPAAADFDDEVAGLLESFNSVFEPGPVRHLALGDCPQPGCGGTLRGVLPAVNHHDRRPDLVLCESGHTLPPRQWLGIAGRLGQAGSYGGER